MGVEKGFVQLMAIIDTLLGPKGCPWDKKQTANSLIHMLLEEVYEAIDDIERGEQLADEMGDILMTALMLAKAAEREGLFVWDRPFFNAAEKLIRRHPHVFKNERELTVEEVERQWAENKEKEQSQQKRTGPFDGICVSLPALSKAQKCIQRAKNDHRLQDLLDQPSDDREFEYGRVLAKIVLEAEQDGVQAERALRTFCSTLIQGLGREDR